MWRQQLVYYIFDCSWIVCRILCHHFSSSSAAVFLWWRPTVVWAAPHLTPSSHSCLYYQEGKGGNRSVFAQLLFPSSLFKKKLESVSIKTVFVDFLVLFAYRGYILVVGNRNKLIFGREGGAKRLIWCYQSQPSPGKIQVSLVLGHSPFLLLLSATVFGTSKWGVGRTRRKVENVYPKNAGFTTRRI